MRMEFAIPLQEFVKQARQEQLKAKQLESEGRIILRALEAARFSKTKAAKSLGISRTTLWRKMKEVGIE